MSLFVKFKLSFERSFFVIVVFSLLFLSVKKSWRHFSGFNRWSKRSLKYLSDIFSLNLLFKSHFHGLFKSIFH